MKVVIFRDLNLNIPSDACRTLWNYLSPDFEETRGHLSVKVNKFLSHRSIYKVHFSIDGKEKKSLLLEFTLKLTELHCFLMSCVLGAPQYDSAYILGSVRETLTGFVLKIGNAVRSNASHPLARWIEDNKFSSLKVDAAIGAPSGYTARLIRGVSRSNRTRIEEIEKLTGLSEGQIFIRRKEENEWTQKRYTG